MSIANSQIDQPRKSTVMMQAAPKASGQPPIGAVKTGDSQAALIALLRVEADARDVTTEHDLMLLIANEMRKLTRARQIFVLKTGYSGRQEVQAISSLPSVDRNAPLVQYIEEIVQHSAAKKLLGAAGQLDTSAADAGGAGAAYPFRSLMWLPMRHGKRALIGGIVLAREDVWNESDLVVATRLARTFTHAWFALIGNPRQIVRDILAPKRWHALAVVAIVMALCLIEVPLSALAPVEVVPRDPFVVAAPIDGVIESIAVDPNQAVRVGDLLVKLSDTTLRNKLELAERDAQVAEARLKQANQMALSDPKGMHEIAIARSELAVKLAERDFARELLAKSEIRAVRSGVVIYSDKRELTGRPVALGERILEVADADKIEARIELPVADVITLVPGARAKLFLDSDPLRPWSGYVRRADYKARVTENDKLALRVVASFLHQGEKRSLPRLGVRGTAQISGEDVPLGLYLFRRPLTALRQWIGL